MYVLVVVCVRRFVFVLLLYCFCVHLVEVLGEDENMWKLSWI